MTIRDELIFRRIYSNDAEVRDKAREWAKGVYTFIYDDDIVWHCYIY